MAKKTEYTREELYDLVWSKPVTHIAKEYGFSDSGIRKICKNFNIPLPKSGYWSKVKHNKKIVKELLPKQDDNPIITLVNSMSGQYVDNAYLSEVVLKKQEIEKDNTLNLIVTSRLSKPHKYIVATKEYYKKIKVIEQRGGWRGQVDSTDVIMMDVSNEIIPRALRFMNTLIKTLENRGHKIYINHVTKVEIYEQSYAFRLMEKSKRVKRVDKYGGISHDLVPIGDLCFKIDRTYPKKEWSDTKTIPLEDRLLDILVWLEIKAEKDRQREIEYKTQCKIREEERKKEVECRKLQDAELSKFESLLHTATRWNKSQYLRNYIQEFEQYAIKTNTLDSVKKEWIAWAKEKADWYDPFIEKEVEYLKEIDRDTLKPRKKSKW